MATRSITEGTVVIRGATLVDGSPHDPLTRGVVVIRDSRITAVGVEPSVHVPVDARVLDADGCTIVPGLINLHDHISRKRLRLAESGLSFRDEGARLLSESSEFLALHASNNVISELRSGVTTIRDFGLPGAAAVAVKRAINTGLIDGPRLLVAGNPICITGGHAHQWSREADGPDEVLRAVREQLRSGADCIKFMASGGLIGFPDEDPDVSELNPDELLAGIQEAHKFHRRTAAHAYPTQAIKNAIAAGIDSIEHGVYLDEESVALMREHGVALVPTMSGLSHLAFQFEQIGRNDLCQAVTDRVLTPHMRRVRLAVGAGLRVGTGSDTAGEIVEELELIQEASGLSNLDCIRSATRVAAEIAGLEHTVGTLEPGKVADLVVIDGQPLERLGDLRRPRWVVHNGRVFDGEPLPLGIRMRILRERHGRTDHLRPPSS